MRPESHTRAAQALDEEYYPGTPTGHKGLIKIFILRIGPSASHPHAHEVAGFGVGAFGELSAECPELFKTTAWVQVAFYVAYHGDIPPKEALNAQRPRI